MTCFLLVSTGHALASLVPVLTVCQSVSLHGDGSMPTHATPTHTHPKQQTSIMLWHVFESRDAFFVGQANASPSASKQVPPCSCRAYFFDSRIPKVSTHPSIDSNEHSSIVTFFHAHISPRCLSCCLPTPSSSSSSSSWFQSRVQGQRANEL